MDEIVENVKMAREYALLGNYDTSLVYFQGVLQQIQKYIGGIVDPVRRQKWHQVGWPLGFGVCGRNKLMRRLFYNIKLCPDSSLHIQKVKLWIFNIGKCRGLAKT